MDKLELFGKELMKKVRDASIKEYLSIQSGEMKSAEAKEIYDLITSFSTSDMEKIDKIIFDIIDRVLHKFLWMLEGSTDFGIADKAVIDPGENLAMISDGLTGELYGEFGWILKYSNYPDVGGGK